VLAIPSSNFRVSELPGKNLSRIFSFSLPEVYDTEILPRFDIDPQNFRRNIGCVSKRCYQALMDKSPADWATIYIPHKETQEPSTFRSSIEKCG